MSPFSSALGHILTVSFSVCSYLQEKQGFGSLDHKEGCDVEGEERDESHGSYQLVTQPFHILENKLLKQTTISW